MKRSISTGFWRSITLAVITIGAVGSLVLMFNSARNQKSILLIALFTAWVLSPFIVLSGATLISGRWSATTRLTLYGLTIILSACSLISYGGGFSVPGTRPAFMFLAVPFVSWVLMLAAMPIVRYLEKRKKNK